MHAASTVLAICVYDLAAGVLLPEEHVRFSAGAGLKHLQARGTPCMDTGENTVQKPLYDTVRRID